MWRPSDAIRIPTLFIYRDYENDPLVDDAFLTLYDTRANQPHRSAEYRFYFPTTQVSERASTNDLLVIAKRRGEGLLVIIAQNSSSSSQQIEWLFGYEDDLRSEEHTSELQSLMRISYAVFCLKKKTHNSYQYYYSHS